MRLGFIHPFVTSFSDSYVLGCFCKRQDIRFCAGIAQQRQSGKHVKGVQMFTITFRYSNKAGGVLL